MAWLKVNKDKNKLRGIIYIAEVEGKGILTGYLCNTYKVPDIMRGIADKVITKRTIPKVRLLKYKKVGNVIKAEAELNSELFDYYDKRKEYFHVPLNIIEELL